MNFFCYCCTNLISAPLSCSTIMNSKLQNKFREKINKYYTLPFIIEIWNLVAPTTFTFMLKDFYCLIHSIDPKI